MHNLEGLVDLSESLAVGDKFINLESASEVILNKGREFTSSLDTTKGRSSPYTASDELEWSGLNLLSCGGDTDDDTLTPTLMAGFESSSHDANVTSTIEGIVTTTVGDLNEVFLDRFPDFGGVDEIGCAEFTCPFLFAVIGVYGNDFLGAIGDAALDDTEADTASAEDGAGRTLLDLRSTSGSTETSGDTASKETSFVQRSLRVDGNNRDIGDNYTSEMDGNWLDQCTERRWRFPCSVRYPFHVLGSERCRQASFLDLVWYESFRTSWSFHST
jgi:hypothetical protein